MEVAKPVLASSVLLIRDVASNGARPQSDRRGERDLDGVEVLLLGRDQASSTFPSALVFPGGTVDEADYELDHRNWVGPPLASWFDALGVDEPVTVRAMLAAAIRETFEESGVLLARDDDGAVVDSGRASLAPARQRLLELGSGTWPSWLRANDIRLDFGALQPWSWWVTPADRPRRFDTRFFVAVLPPNQTVTHDLGEMISAQWLAPGLALERADLDEIELRFPTRKNLEVLRRHRNADGAWRAAQRREMDLRRIEPSVVYVDGHPMAQHPHEAVPEEI